MTNSERLLQEQVNTLVMDLAMMRDRAETAEAALAQLQSEKAKYKNPGVFAYSDNPSALIEDLRRHSETAEDALAKMTQLHKDRQDDLAFEYERANRAEAALTAMIERKEYFRQCWEVAEAALAEVQNRTCLWRWHDEHGWCATCGGGGIDKWERFGKTYCPSCGAKIVEPHEIAP